MNFRPYILGSMLLLGIGGNLLLLGQETVVPPKAQAKHLMKATDPLADIVYVVSKREENFKKFGLDEEATKKAIKSVKDLANDDGNVKMITTFIEEIDDLDRLSDALCLGEPVPPRYSALAYLIKEEGGRRDTIRLGRVTRLEREDWAVSGRIEEVFAEVEMAKVREPDATLMGIAAILTNHEMDVFEKTAPWGTKSRWSWEKVKENNPGIESRVIDYLAMMHFVMEVVTANDGFCGDEA